jgi:acetaldehyde dehydrogenase (acetylating)
MEGAVVNIVKAALGNAADKRHLAALEPGADGTARAGRLALATTTAGFAAATGLTLAKTLATVLGAGTGFQIM